MEMNCKELCVQPELVDVASIEIAPEKLQKQIEIPEVKRKRGRPKKKERSHQDLKDQDDTTQCQLLSRGLVD